MAEQDQSASCNRSNQPNAAFRNMISALRNQPQERQAKTGIHKTNYWRQISR